MDVSYHYSCNKTFTKDRVYIRRAHDREKQGEEKEMFKTDRVMRSSLKTAFDKSLCLFCQCGADEEPLHKVEEYSTEQELLQAFAECPSALALFKIRYELAFDVVAGEIKYHTKYWVVHITRRIPDFVGVKFKGSTLSSPSEAFKSKNLPLFESPLLPSPLSSSPLSPSPLSPVSEASLLSSLSSNKKLRGRKVPTQTSNPYVTNFYEESSTLTSRNQELCEKIRQKQPLEHATEDITSELIRR